MREGRKYHDGHDGRTPLGTPAVSINGDHATITTLTRATGENVSPEDVLVEHGLDPAEWDVTSYTSNRWHAPTKHGKQQLEQSKLVARRSVLSMVRPAAAREPGWVAPRPKRFQRSKSRLIAVFGDPHCPLEERDFVDAQLAWLREYQPTDVWLMGDAADNSPWKRHKRNRRIDCSPQEALDSTYRYLADIRAAVPDARIRLVYGNHDYWIIDRINEAVPQLATLRRPGENGTQIISLNDWLRLDELRIEANETQGEYHDVTVQIADDLVGLHGVKSGPYGGAVREFDTWEGASVLQGHDHKAAIVLISKRLANNTEVQRVAISVGTSARRDLGYDHKRNVNQAFTTVTMHGSGEWHPELAIFNPQTRSTTWRDWIYTPEAV